MKNIASKLLFIITIFSFSNWKAFSHCEIPCGIYQDSLRIALLKEHITTIEKSMEMILSLQKEKEINQNQITRWIINKEEHANKIQYIATQYFLFQRIKLSDDKLTKKRNAKMIENLHKLCVYAMKTKQSVNTEFITEMKKAVENFSFLYFNKKKLTT